MPSMELLCGSAVMGIFCLFTVAASLRSKRNEPPTPKPVFVDAAQEALQYVENVKAGACDGGTSNILNFFAYTMSVSQSDFYLTHFNAQILEWNHQSSVKFDNTQWKAEADAAVRLSNLLTKNWLITNGTGGYVDDPLLYAMTRTTIEIEALAFGSAIAFEPYFYRNMSKFCAYSFHTGNGTIRSHDISVEYDYFPSEWYLGKPDLLLGFHKKRRIGSSTAPSEAAVQAARRILPILLVDVVSRSKEKATNLTTILDSNVTLRLSEYSESGVKVHKNVTNFSEPRAEYDDGFWTRPYFDCGGGDIWMITFNSPIFALISGTVAFAGVATCDIALNSLDIDQCDADRNGKKAALNVFQGTHHCKPTTMCVTRAGFGFHRGTYLCECRPGSYFPDRTSELRAYTGSQVEEAFARYKSNYSNDYLEKFDCLACPEGCTTCSDDTPCLAKWNWVIRGVLLCIVFCMLIGVTMTTLSIIQYSGHPVIKSASPLFLKIICLGGTLALVAGLALFFRPSRFSCMVRVWFIHTAFTLIYGPLLLKNWRIATIFNSVQAQKVALNDKKLLIRLAVIVGITVIYLMAWTIIRPANVQTVQDGYGLKFRMCHESWMDYALVIAQCVFLLWGVYLCYKIRDVASSFNESKLIAWTIYNTIFMKNFLMIIRIFMIGMVGPDILYLMYIFELQVPVTCTFSILFGPKLYLLRKIVVRPNTNIDDEELGTRGSATMSRGFVSKFDHRY